MSELTADELEALHAIFDLARTGNPLLAEYLDEGLTPNLTNSSGDTLLILAAYHRRTETVRALLAHGADVERVNDRGQTALGCAVFRRDAELVQLLLKAGADPDGGTRSAREFASFFELDDIAALLPPAAATPEAADGSEAPSATDASGSAPASGSASSSGTGEAA